jgi:hypothetical protein
MDYNVAHHERADGTVKRTDVCLLRHTMMHLNVTDVLEKEREQHVLFYLIGKCWSVRRSFAVKGFSASWDNVYDCFFLSWHYSPHLSLVLLCIEVS